MSKWICNQVVCVLLISWLCHSLAKPVHASENETARPESFYDELIQMASNARNDVQFQALRKRVRQLQQQPYTPPETIPSEFTSLSYDAYRQIQFRQENAIWRADENPFWIEAFHPGFVHQNKVRLNIIEHGLSKEIPFSTSYFDYGETTPPTHSHSKNGFAGVKLVGRFPQADTYQEMLTFLGASYFRAHTAETVYGVSNRALAINVGLNQPEEFPAFREFWIAKPHPRDTSITAFALLESPSCVGAYQFVLHPQQGHVDVDVKCELNFRSKPEKVGLAPITSMWMWGDGQKPPALETRPHCHDSDGLLIQDGEQWTWRPLTRLSYPSISRFAVKDLKGFGLSQRNLNFEDYNDTGALYHRRPSVWITPQNKWPAGSMELFEIAAVHEGIDNIGAYWVPEESLDYRKPLKLNYRIRWSHGEQRFPSHQKLAFLKKTSLQRSPGGDLVKAFLQFQMPKSETNATLTQWQPQVQIIRGTLLEAQWTPLKKRQEQNLHSSETPECQLEILVAPESQDPIEIHCSLERNGKTQSENCRLLISPTAPEYRYPQVYLRQE